MVPISSAIPWQHSLTSSAFGQHSRKVYFVMITGVSLDTLGEMVLNQNAAKRDIIAPTKQLMVATPDAKPSLSFNVNGNDMLAELTPFAVRQIGTWAGIPAKYLDRISQKDDQDLLLQNVNHWLQKSNDQRLVRMLQTDKTIARAFLSDRFKRLDNYELALNVMPRLRQAGMSVKSAALTDTRLYIQAVDNNLMAWIKAGPHQRTKTDRLHAGVVISNSEVGFGRLLIEAMIWREVCGNGMIAGTSLHRRHLGRSLVNDDGQDITELFTDETHEATDRAFWLQVRDVLDAALSEARFHAIVDRMQASTEVELPASPDRIVEVTTQRLGLSSEEGEAVMRHLFSDGDSTLYGLMNAVTRTAEDSKSYDRAVELERLGSDVLTFEREMFSKN